MKMARILQKCDDSETGKESNCERERERERERY
jgi:hypothetical protein